VSFCCKALLEVHYNIKICLSACLVLTTSTQSGWPRTCSSAHWRHGCRRHGHCSA
jgi:hypothetical protein